MVTGGYPIRILRSPWPNPTATAPGDPVPSKGHLHSRCLTNVGGSIPHLRCSWSMFFLVFRFCSFCRLRVCKKQSFLLKVFCYHTKSRDAIFWGALKPKGKPPGLFWRNCCICSFQWANAQRVKFSQRVHVGVSFFWGTPEKVARSPSSALSLFLGWEGSPTKIDHREKIGYQIILTSLLEDLGGCFSFRFPGNGEGTPRRVGVCPLSFPFQVEP